MTNDDRSGELASHLVDSSFRMFEQSTHLFRSCPDVSLALCAHGVELLLKARLAASHWQLVAASKSTSWSDLRSGDVVTLGFDGVLQRVRAIADGVELTETKRSSPAFEALRKERNVAVHLGHHDASSDATASRLARVQVRSLVAIELLMSRWPDGLRTSIEGRFWSVQRTIRELDDYLDERADAVRADLFAKAEQGHVGVCPRCERVGLAKTGDTSELLVAVDCLVCGDLSVGTRGPCQSCGKGVLAAITGGTESFEFTCPYCEHDHEGLAAFGGVDLDWSAGMRQKDLLLVRGSAMCAQCESYQDMTIFVHSGEQHRLCCSCGLNTAESGTAQSSCGRCDQWWVGSIDLEHSSWLGCPACQF